MRASTLLAPAASTLLLTLPLHAQPNPVPPGWGLNSRLEWAPPALVPVELATLRPGRLTWLREDLTGPDVWPAHEPLFRTLHAAGYRVLGLVPYDATTNGHDPQAVPDLRDIYRAAELLARRADRDVAAWELDNEPDVAFCAYLPDRFTGIARATALGLRSASAHPILLPSLALPPGPWAERAAANGLFTCGDAANLHYYGHPQDFPALLALARRFLSDHGAHKNLPLWITEIGLKIPTASPDPDTQRDRQTAYFAATMRTASAAHVAAYLPYAFEDAAYSLADPTGAPYPALDLYLRASRTLQLTAPATLDRPAPVSPVILQWAPDRDASLPDKVSGCYQFTAPAMPGHIRLYNFSPHAVHGILTITNLTHGAAIPARQRPRYLGPLTGMGRGPIDDRRTYGLPPRESDPPKSLYPEQGASRSRRTSEPASRLLGPKLDLGASPAPREVVLRANQSNEVAREITLPPNGRLDLPITFSAPSRGYLRETATFLWHDQSGAPDSPLSFGLATPPRPRDFTPLPLALLRPQPDPGGFTWIDAPAPYEITSTSGPWLGLNGLEITSTAAPITHTTWSHRRETAPTTWDPAAATFFRLDPTRETDAPVMAIARVAGLPDFEFLRLRADRLLEQEIYLRLDLLTAAGERYTIFEHGGSNPAQPSREVWLNRHDFHLYFWSRYPARPHDLDPASVREIQLRLRFATPGIPVRLTLQALRAK